MKPNELNGALRIAVEAARAAGAVMKKNLLSAKQIHEEHQHDIKLELDQRCQRLIDRTLRRAFPEVALLGEEGVSGPQDAPDRWVVDPIDGTVNFTYGVPHACVSIALQHRQAATPPTAPRKGARGKSVPESDPYETVVGVVYDPFCDELWTARRGEPARLNGRIIRSSQRNQLRQAIVCVGFSKQRENIEKMLAVFGALLHRVRKVRITGSAALDLTYVASGRFDAFIEAGVQLWDIAAGGLILECAQGEFWHRPLPVGGYEIIASNGLIRRQIEKARSEALEKA